MIVFSEIFFTGSYKSLYCHCNSFNVEIRQSLNIGVKLVCSTVTGLLSRVIVWASRKIKPEMRAVRMRDCVPCQDAICFSSRAFCVDEDYLSSNLQTHRTMCCRCLYAGIVTSVHPFSHRLLDTTIPPTNHVQCFITKQYVVVWL